MIHLKTWNVAFGVTPIDGANMNEIHQDLYDLI